MNYELLIISENVSDMVAKVRRRGVKGCDNSSAKSDNLDLEVDKRGMSG
jgi:hypothetical protein